MNNITSREVVGLIPAAGKATRISPLPCSKELFPVGYHSLEDKGHVRPKVISNYLLDRMKLADINKAYIILRNGKWDIPSYYGNGKSVAMDIAYLMMDLPFGVPYTLDQAYPFVKDCNIALGFPDMLIYPEDSFVKIISKLHRSKADIVLGLFPAMQSDKTDMVDVDDAGNISSIYIKPDKSHLQYAWEIAVWTPVFTEFMHNFILSQCKVYAAADMNNGISHICKEMHFGNVIQAALDENMAVDSVIYHNGNCVDIGTSEDLLKAVQMTNQILKDI